MHVSESELQAAHSRSQKIQVTTVTATRGVHPDVVALFQTVYGEEPVKETWPMEAVRDRLNNAIDGQVLPTCLAAWGNERLGASGKLIGLLIGFELTPADHWRAFGKKDMSAEIREGFESSPGRIGYVQDLLVPQEFRRAGVGRALLEKAEDFFRSQLLISFFCRARAAKDDPFRVACIKRRRMRVIVPIDDNYVLLGRRLR